MIFRRLIALGLVVCLSSSAVVSGGSMGMSKMDSPLTSAGNGRNAPFVTQALAPSPIAQDGILPGAQIKTDQKAAKLLRSNTSSSDPKKRSKPAGPAPKITGMLPRHAAFLRSADWEDLILVGFGLQAAVDISMLRSHNVTFMNAQEIWSTLWANKDIARSSLEWAVRRWVDLLNSAATAGQLRIIDPRVKNQSLDTLRQAIGSKKVYDLLFQAFWKHLAAHPQKDLIERTARDHADRLKQVKQIQSMRDLMRDADFTSNTIKALLRFLYENDGKWDPAAFKVSGAGKKSSSISTTPDYVPVEEIKEGEWYILRTNRYRYKVVKKESVPGREGESRIFLEIDPTVTTAAFHELKMTRIIKPDFKDTGLIPIPQVTAPSAEPVDLHSSPLRTAA